MAAGAEIKAPRGTYDVLPDEMDRRRPIYEAAARRFGVAGYRRLETPAFEETGLFARSVGAATDIVRKEMYTFEDLGGRSLTLKPEGTAPVCRAYMEHGMKKLPQPVKLWYADSMFRYEAPQSGRFRQHHQIGCEAIGSADPALDVELIALLEGLYRDLGIDGLRLRLSSLGDSACRPEYVRELREHLLSTGAFTSEQRERLEVNPLRAFDWQDPEAVAATDAAPKIVDRLCDDCRASFATVGALLGDLGIEHEVDPRLVRGLDYYTRTLFEFECALLGAQSGVGGGGRYDGLIAEIGGPPTPAAGWATGVERVALAIERSTRLREADAGRPGPDAFVALADRGALPAAVKLLRDLRERGVAADADYAGRSLKGQMKHAGRLGAARVIIAGAHDVPPGAAIVRDMATGEQRELPIDRVPDEI